LIRAFVHDKHESRLQQLEQSIRFYCRSNKQTPGMVWLSARTLSGDRLFRGTSETLRLARELAAAGHIGRVTARGRGRGKGRTLYWLPSTKKWRVLAELRREDMPHAAIVAAIAFFVHRERVVSAENVTDGVRQQSLGLSTFGTETEEGTPAAPARRARAPSEPPSLQPEPSNVPSTPPSDGRLSSPGLSRVVSKRLRDGQISEALTRMKKHVKYP
jgi:hypothetical protein